MRRERFVALSHLLSHISMVSTPAFLIDLKSKRVIFNAGFLRLEINQLPVKEFYYLNDEELNRFFRIPEFASWVNDCLDRPRAVCRSIDSWLLLKKPAQTKLKLLPLAIDEQTFVTGYFYSGDDDL